MRRVLSIPSSVLVVCLFLPALRVCGHAETPATFPPCYAAYLGGLGVLIVALARSGVSRLAAIGAAIPLALLALTAGAIVALWCACASALWAVVGVAFAAGSVAAAVTIVHAYVRRPPSEIAMANVVFAQAIVSSAWTGLLAGDRDAMWGSYLALAAALAMAVCALAWRSDAARRALESSAELPQAFARRLPA